MTRTGFSALRRMTAVLAWAALLAGCPIPQPLPGVGTNTGVPITPPRVQTTSASPQLALTSYQASRDACPSGSVFLASANIVDVNAEEPVEVRWFVDYDPSSQLMSNPIQIETLPPPTDSAQYLRYPKALSFIPWDFDVSGPQVHVVEMTISNGFLPIGATVPPGSLPNRTAATGYEVQVFRWTYQPTVDGSCGP